VGRRRLLLAGLAGLALVAAGIGWRRLSAPAPSDAERIRALFAASARAVEEKRVGDAVAPLAERFQGPAGFGRAEVKRAIAAAALRGQWLSVSVTGDRIEVEGESARAAVTVVAARSGKGRTLAELLPQDATGLWIDARLAREDGAWRVVGAEWREIPLGAALAGPGER
jgi:hypothetical protein